MTTEQELIQCIQATNRFLTQEHLDGLDYVALLRNVHPLYRSDYARKLFQEGKISEYQKKLFVKTI